jgi:hypothetical protein
MAANDAATAIAAENRIIWASSWCGAREFTGGGAGGKGLIAGPSHIAATRKRHTAGILAGGAWLTACV